MSRKDEPEVALAAAVIQRVVYDLKYGSPEHRQRALEDLEAGGVEYWIDVVSVQYDAADSIRSGLKVLAKSRGCLAS